MILYKLTFDDIDKDKRKEADELIENYISALYHNGQACGEYFTVLQNGRICAYLILQGIRANTKKYHCEYGKKWLAKISEILDITPTWELIDDEAPKRDVNWNKSPFLYLYTSLNDWESPIYRGDNGKSIPLYLFSGEHEDRESIYFWQRTYQSYDSIWMRCGELEIPTYKQLATPSSELAVDGRKICSYIEKTSGVPTYYYLMRHWGRRNKEELRKCPGCGKHWSLGNNYEEVNSSFHKFDFMCEPCRLVSHVSNSCDDERHAVIGEWRKPKIRK